MQRTLLILMLFVLIILIGVNAMQIFRPQHQPTIHQPLSDLLPTEIEGWNCRDVPLASTPEGNERVLDILALDDVVSREYTNRSTKILIYAAYWKPGSQPYSSVAVHNPDSCWVHSGWMIEQRENNRPLQIGKYELKTHEWGIYTIHNTKKYVMFWHLLGGEPNTFIKYMRWNGTGLDSIKRRFYFIFNISQLGLDLNRDQLFVRISSTVPFERLEHDADFNELLKQLTKLNIFKSNVK